MDLKFLWTSIVQDTVSNTLLMFMAAGSVPQASEGA